MHSANETVRVDLGARSYDIVIGSGTLAQAAQIILDVRRVTRALVFCDENVERPHADQVATCLAERDIDVDLLTTPAGEASKSVEMASLLWQQLLELEADRDTLAVAVGGGVIGDLTGFVAATYGRGMPLVQVPTTLLAQVDSSVGGKVAVNLPQAKNMVGTFWQPAAVIIDTDVLATLPDREYRAGLAEVVKYGAIADAAFFEFLEQHLDAIADRDATTLRTVIRRCCEIKAEVVSGDERDTSGQRAILNYGHTFAHGFEAVGGYGQLLHGEAVAIGMVCAARLATSLGRTPAELTDRLRQLLQQLKLPVDPPPLDRDELLASMRRDKKVAFGKLRFVLASRLGHVELVGDVPEEAIHAALEPLSR